MPRKKNTPHQLGPLFAEPDLVDRIFDYIAEQFPERFGGACLDADAMTSLKAATRAEFGGADAYIPNLSPAERHRRVTEVLRLFNGRNASEVARRLRISRATVYRILKQPGGQTCGGTAENPAPPLKPSQFSET